MNQVITFIHKYRRIILSVLVLLLIVGLQHFAMWGESLIGMIGIGLFAAAALYLLLRPRQTNR